MEFARLCSPRMLIAAAGMISRSMPPAATVTTPPARNAPCGNSFRVLNGRSVTPFGGFFPTASTVTGSSAL